MHDMHTAGVAALFVQTLIRNAAAIVAAVQNTAHH
jgi:hypothetical protein